MKVLWLLALAAAIAEVSSKSLGRSVRSAASVSDGSIESGNDTTEDRQKRDTEAETGDTSVTKSKRSTDDSGDEDRKKRETDGETSDTISKRSTDGLTNSTRTKRAAELNRSFKISTNCRTVILEHISDPVKCSMITLHELEILLHKDHLDHLKHDKHDPHQKHKRSDDWFDNWPDKDHKDHGGYDHHVKHDDHGKHDSYGSHGGYESHYGYDSHDGHGSHDGFGDHHGFDSHDLHKSDHKSLGHSHDPHSPFDHDPHKLFDHFFHKDTHTMHTPQISTTPHTTKPHMSTTHTTTTHTHSSGKPVKHNFHDHSPGVCRYDPHRAIHDPFGACLCVATQDTCTKGRSGCIWEVEPKSGIKECISKAEQFYIKLHNLLKQRGKKNFAINIRYGATGARGNLPYGPWGPAVVGYGNPSPSTTLGVIGQKAYKQKSPKKKYGGYGGAGGYGKSGGYGSPGGYGKSGGYGSPGYGGSGGYGSPGYGGSGGYGGYGSYGSPGGYGPPGGYGSPGGYGGPGGHSQGGPYGGQIAPHPAQNYNFGNHGAPEHPIDYQRNIQIDDSSNSDSDDDEYSDEKSENNAHSLVGQLGSGHGQLGSGQGQLQMQNPQNAMPMQMQGQHLQGLPNLMGIQGGASGPMMMPAPNFNQQLPMAQNLNLQQMAPNLQQPMPNPLNNQAAQAALNLG